MAYVQVMIHAVWGTKNRQPVLTKELRFQLFEHIRMNAKCKQIYIDRINGYHDHIHCLFALNADMAVSKVIQLLKGESAYWVNQQGLTSTRFEWAKGYFAGSVSESLVNNVRKYIDHQEEHHRKISFDEEYQQFLLKHSIDDHG